MALGAMSGACTGRGNGAGWSGNDRSSRQSVQPRACRVGRVGSAVGAIVVEDGAGVAFAAQQPQHPHERVLSAALQHVSSVHTPICERDPKATTSSRTQVAAWMVQRSRLRVAMATWR